MQFYFMLSVALIFVEDKNAMNKALMQADDAALFLKLNYNTVCSILNHRIYKKSLDIIQKNL